MVNMVSCKKDILKNRDLHEFALYCANSVKHLMKDRRSLKALEVKRDWLDGKATDEELRDACAVAEAAYIHAAYVSATCYAAYTSTAATVHAAYVAVYATTVYTAYVAHTATVAVYAATVYYVHDHTTRADQAKWLRKNCKPNFNL